MPATASRPGRSSTRPKGYMINWQPRSDIAHWLALVRDVLDEYAAFGPMTVRQVFYRLVGQHGFDKTEQAYKRLAEWIVKARRAQIISFDAIRDDGTVLRQSTTWASPGAFWDAVQFSADSFRLDRQADQPAYIELWCEAAGMAPMLEGIVREWSIPVYATGGFGSVTVTYEIAQRVLERDVPTVFLHVGDYDPSGESIFTSMCQDVGAFVVQRHGGRWDAATGETLRVDHRGVGALFKPSRIALTEAQVAEYDLPTAPPKSSDSRSANWVGETTQAEAMPPDLLQAVVRAAVREHIDQDALAETLRREATARAAILDALADTNPR